MPWQAMPSERRSVSAFGATSAHCSRSIGTLDRERVIGVERAFGTDEPLALSIGPYTVHVRGYIDRIDVERGSGTLRDLKTGKAKPRKPDEIDPSIDAQLALYALVAKALSQAWGLPQKLSAVYVYPAGVRHTERAFRDTDYNLLQQRANTWLEMTMELAAARRFPRTSAQRRRLHLLPVQTSLWSFGGGARRTRARFRGG